MRKRTLLVALQALPLALVPPATAQTAKQYAVVFYDHRGAHGPIVTSRVGKTEGLGGLTTVRVPKGEAACFIVKRANSLLYGYSMNPEALKNETTRELDGLALNLAKALSSQALEQQAKNESETLKQVEPALNKVSKAATPQQMSVLRGWLDRSRGTQRDFSTLSPILVQSLPDSARTALQRVVEDPAPGLAESAKQLAELVAQADGLRAASRADTSLDVTVRKVRVIADSAVRLQASALTRAQGAQGQVVPLLLETIKALTAQVAKARDEYVTAATNDRFEFCHTLQDARVRLHLVVTTKPTEAGKSPKSDTVSTFLAEPESEKRFEVVPALVASFALSRERSFEVKGDKIESSLPGPHLAPSVFAMWRMADRSPLWAAVGTATGRRSNVPDAHLGMVLRLGDPTSGTSLVLGAGLAFAQAPVGLDGAQVGSPLPQGKTLNDVLNYQLRYGPTLFLSVSGLALPIGGTGIAASPDAKK